MGKANFSDDFKRDAVAQITERGYPVAGRYPDGWASARTRFMPGRRSFRAARGRRQGRRGSSLEARVAESVRGARHPKKTTAYFAKDAK